MQTCASRLTHCPLNCPNSKLKSLRPSFTMLQVAPGKIYPKTHRSSLSHCSTFQLIPGAYQSILFSRTVWHHLPLYRQYRQRRSYPVGTLRRKRQHKSCSIQQTKRNPRRPNAAPWKVPVVRFTTSWQWLETISESVGRLRQVQTGIHPNVENVLKYVRWPRRKNFCGKTAH